MPLTLRTHDDDRGLGPPRRPVRGRSRAVPGRLAGRQRDEVATRGDDPSIEGAHDGDLVRRPTVLWAHSTRVPAPPPTAEAIADPSIARTPGCGSSTVLPDRASITHNPDDVRTVNRSAGPVALGLAFRSLVQAVSSAAAGAAPASRSRLRRVVMAIPLAIPVCRCHLDRAAEAGRRFRRAHPRRAHRRALSRTRRAGVILGSARRSVRRYRDRRTTGTLGEACEPTNAEQGRYEQT